MRRLICLFLVLALVLSIVPATSATDTKEEYFTVKVEYSDNIGQLENLSLMLKDNHVFVDAKMIAERFGYLYKEGDIAIAIYNPDSIEILPRKLIVFNFNSTQVSNLVLDTMIDSYVAPFESIKNSSGTWIPFEYSLLLMNSSMMLHDGMIFIDIPTKNITDSFIDIAKQMQLYQFDYADDFGYSGLDEKVLAGSSHLINVFNGILTMDGDSWLVLFQQFLGSTEAYDKKYAEDIALLLCTESDKELNASIESINKIVDLFSDDGNLGTILSRIDDSLDKDIGTLYGQCEQLLQKIKDSNVPTVTYNRTYQALETALDKQTWFSETGGTVLQVQKGISSEVPFTMLKVAAVMLEVCGYAREFQNQDAFSVGAVSKYLDINSSDYDLLVTMKKEMDKYCTSISDDLSGYMGMRLQENIGKLVLDFLPKEKALGKIIGAQASSLLLAWDLASAFVPFVKDGLSSADNFELSLYAQIIQNDTFLNYVNERSRAFSNESSINAENLYSVAQLCYTYLKACYITREAALASLKVKPDSVLERIQPLVDYQNEINEEIAQMLVALKRANKTNEYYVYGILPNDNNHYLSVFDDGKLVNWLTGSPQSQPSVEVDTPIETSVDVVTEESGTDYSLYLTAINNAKSISVYQSGEGFLYDLDGDGVEELFLMYCAEFPRDIGDTFPCSACSVYTIHNNKLISLMDNCKLREQAGGGIDSIGVFRLNNNEWFATHINSAWEEGSGDYWKLYSLRDSSLQLVFDIEGHLKYNLHSYNTDYDSSYSLFDGERSNYNKYEDWEKGIAPVFEMDGYDFKVDSGISYDELIRIINAKGTEQGSDSEQPSFLPSDTTEKEMYSAYLFAGGCDNILGNISEYDTDAEVESVLADFNGDGIQECFIFFSDPWAWNSAGAGNYYLLTIINGSVQVLYSGINSGGNWMWAKIQLKKNAQSGRLVIVEADCWRDSMVPYSGGATTRIYSYTKSVLTCSDDYIAESYAKPEYVSYNRETIERVKAETSLFYENDENVWFFKEGEDYITEEEYDNILGGFIDLGDEYCFNKGTMDQPIP